MLIQNNTFSLSTVLRFLDAGVPFVVQIFLVGMVGEEALSV